MAKENKHLEIERRWLLRGLPEWYILHATQYYNIPLDVRHSFFTTVYIISDPELEVRIRRRLFNGEVTYSVETKLGLGLTRQESPKLLADAKLFDYYFGTLGKPYFSKDHWEITLPSSQKWEINLLREPNSVQGLVVAEMEFDSEEEAKQFSEKDFPDWLKPLIVKEVTDDPRYNGKNLAVYGKPNPE